MSLVVLELVLLTLRACHILAWPLWLATLPFWIASALLATAIIFALASAILEEWRSARNNARNP